MTYIVTLWCVACVGEGLKVSQSEDTCKSRGSLLKINLRRFHPKKIYPGAAGSPFLTFCWQGLSQKKGLLFCFEISWADDTNSIQECMKIDFLMLLGLILSEKNDDGVYNVLKCQNRWAKRPWTSIFCIFNYIRCLQPISWIRVIGNPHKSLFLSPMLTYFTKKSLSYEYLLQSRCQGPGIEHNGKK